MPDANIGEGKGRAVDHRHCPVAVTGTVASAQVGNVDSVGYRIDRYAVGGDPRTNAGVGEGRAVDHRYGSVRGALAGRIAVAITGNVNLVGDRIDRYRTRVVSADGDIGGGKGRTVDRRHGGASTSGVVAALVGDIDLVGSRFDVQGVGIDSHIHRGGAVGRAVDYGHCPATVGGGTRGIVAARVWNVNFVGYRVDHYAVGPTPGGDSGNDGIARAVNHRYRPRAAAGGIVAVLVGDVDPVGDRVHRHAVGIVPHMDRQGVVSRPVNDGHCPTARTAGIGTAPICTSGGA